MNIHISEEYTQDILDVVLYIARVLYDPQAAYNIKEKAKIVIEEIAKNPKIYPPAPLVQKYQYDYKRAKVGNYYIIFHYDEFNIYISRFVYAGRDLDNINLQIDYSI